MTSRGLWRILRLPLFITAVVDVLSGYAVALLPRLDSFDGTTAALLAGTAAGLYLFGMVQNDVVDVRRDRWMKIPRPLVTGEMGLAGAVVLLALTAGLAAFCAFQIRGAALVFALAAFGAINLYNLGAKHGPSWVAMTVMGLCRVLNFMIGVTAAVGMPRGLNTGLGLFLPAGPLWARQALALFCLTAVVTGYSIMARRRYAASARPWQIAFVVSGLAGFGLIAWSVLAPVHGGGGQIVAPMARVAALLLLALLWPGGLWSSVGPRRRPEEYGRFIERALFWMILMDVAFLVDGLIVSSVAARG
jgi:4-hydroxybenzoate polyprenyltransferase